MAKKPLYKKAYHIPIETAVYVPSTNKKQKAISKKQLNKRVNTVRKDLSRRYGGYTSVQGIGGYVMNNGRLVKEKVVKVTSFSRRKEFKKNKPKIYGQLKSWGKKWGQESMGYEHEGDLYYIDSASGRKIKRKSRRKSKSKSRRKPRKRGRR